jgi:hypothetical protein
MDTASAYIGILLIIIVLSIVHQYFVSRIMRSTIKIAAMVPVPKPEFVFKG